MTRRYSRELRRGAWAAFLCVGLVVTSGCFLFPDDDDDDGGTPQATGAFVTLSELSIDVESGQDALVDIELDVAGPGVGDPTAFSEEIPSELAGIVTLTRTRDAEVISGRTGQYRIAVGLGAPLGFFTLRFRGAVLDIVGREVAGDSQSLSLRITRPETIVQTGAVQAIAAGRIHSVALLEDGTVWAWGGNSEAQVDEERGDNVFVPLQINPLESVVEIAAGFEHTLALSGDGSVHAWGSNEFGQLGDGTFDSRAIPVVVPGVTDAVQVAAGGFYSLALLSDGTVVSWGGNFSGELGIGVIGDPEPRVRAIPGLDSVIEIAAGSAHVLALREDGSVFAWGSGIRGALGDGNPVESNRRSVPGPIFGVADAARIGVAFGTSYVELQDGTLLAFGDGVEGEIGDGALVDRAVPTPVDTNESIDRIITSPAAKGTLVTTTSGEVLGWGRASAGQLAANSVEPFASPLALPVPSMAAVAGGLSHSLALERQGNCGVVWAWGFDGTGPLGDGRVEGGVRAQPRVVPGLGALECVSLSVERLGPGRVVSNLGAIDCGETCTDFYSAGDQVTLGVTEGRDGFLGFGGDCALADGSLNPTEPLNVALTDHRACTAVFFDASVQASPVPRFDQQPLGSIRPGGIIDFDASASTDDGAIVLFEWDFEDDGVFDATGVTVSQRFDVPGSFQVRLRVTDDSGSSAETTGQVDVVAVTGSPTFFDLAVDFTGAGTGRVRLQPIGLSLPNPFACDGDQCRVDDLVEGEVLTLEATAAGGSTFVGFGAGDCDSVSDSECSFTMDSDRRIVVEFREGN